MAQQLITIKVYILILTGIFFTSFINAKNVQKIYSGEKSIIFKTMDGQTTDA